MEKRKKIIITSIITILIFILMLCINSVCYGVTPSNSVKLENGNTQTLSDSGTILMYPRVVYQGNVFCAQHGMKIKRVNYSISKEYTVTDPVLYYILAYGPSNNGVNGYWVNSTQVALWKYLYGNDTAEDAKRILGTLEADPVKSTDNLYTTDYNKGIELYNKAISYGNSTNDSEVTVKIEKISETGTTISYKIFGNYTKLTYKYRWGEGKWNESVHNTGNEKILTLDKKSGKLEIEVTAEKSTPVIKYRILKGSKSQRLLVVTGNGTEKTSATAETDEIVYTNVSLQKYITAVGSKFTESSTSGTLSEKTYGYNMSNRANRNAKDGANININTGVKVSSDTTNKYDDPIKIQTGDYVIYKIELYNNDSSSDAEIFVKDRISEKGTLIGVYDKHPTIGEQLIFNDKIDVEEYTGGTPEYYKYYKWKAKILANSSNAFWVVVQYNQFSSGIISNAAFINDKNNITDYRTQDYDFIKMTTDVSIQKFVEKVGTNFSTTNNTFESLSYKYSKANVDNGSQVERNLAKSTKNATKDVYSINNQAYKENGKKTKAGDTVPTKYSNPIKIQKGDYVSYKIVVYNNKNVEATVTVKDRVSKYGELIGIYDVSDGSPIAVEEWEWYLEKENFDYCRWKSTIAGNSYKTYNVVIKYDQEIKSNVRISNKAFINNDYNESEYKDRDYDYVIFTNYAVSLNKYVSKVTAANGDDPVSYDRSTTRLNEYATDKENANNYNTYKKDNPVLVELGDKVTYTIQLKNEGDNSIKISKIYDYYDSNALEFVSLTPGTKGDTETNDTPDGKTDSSGMKCIEVSLTDFTLEKGESKNIYITFKVKDNSSLEYNHYNIAQVKTITDNNGNAVTDSDGADNNTDEDWIKINASSYAVSLEKYVYQVDGKNVDSREGKAEYTDGSDGKALDFGTESTVTKTQDSTTKYKTAVETSNGCTVTYRIKVKNDGTSSVYISQINDYLPTGVKYNGIEYGAVSVNTKDSNYTVTKYNETNTVVTLENLKDTLIKPGESKDILISVNVTEPNSSINVLKNIAEIAEIKNRNGISVTDTTPNNNRDADYIVLNTGKSSDKVDYNVEKVWLDSSGNTITDTSSLSGIQVQLYQNDKEYGKPATVSKECDEPWKYTWKDLPKYDADGNVYRYTAKEVSADGYTATYENLENLTVITNTSNKTTSDTVDKTVKKIWVDKKESHNEIEVQLYRNGESMGNDYKTTLKYNSEKPEESWTHTWTDLSKYDDSKNEYIYTVKEVSVPTGYVASYTNEGDTMVVTNTIDGTEEKVSKTVKKEWIDSSGNTITDTSSLSAINVQLYQNGEKYGDSITLNTSNSWTKTWTDLPKYDDSKNEYIYTVKEVSVPTGYVASYTVKEDVITISNTKEDVQQEPVQITVEKVWEDENGEDITFEKTDTSIKVQLYRDGKEYGDSITLDTSNSWTYTWRELDKYDKSKRYEYQYTVRELDVPEGYTVSYSDDGDEIVIKNSKMKTTSNKVSKTVQKVWLDSSGNTITDTSKLSEITVQLYQDGKPYGDSITLNASKSWTYTWTDLPKCDTSGNEYQYVVRELVPNGYTEDYSVCGDEIIVTNKKGKDTDTEKISKTVTKVFTDSSGNIMLYEGNVTVQLYQNGVAMDGKNATITFSFDDLTAITGLSSFKGTKTWTDLPKYDASGNEYIYTVKEEDVPEGYTPIYKDEGFTIINQQIDYMNVEVKKVWIDDQETNHDGDSVEVQLYKDGTSMGDEYKETLSKDNTWSCRWSNLPKATYSVQEIEGKENYRATYSVSTSGMAPNETVTYTIRNIYEPGYKPPENPDPPVVDDDIIISGYVWNDAAGDKISEGYDGKFNDYEKPLSGIKVELYRIETEKVVKTKETDQNGYYSFKDDDVDGYIKGEKKDGIWTSTYSYYVRFTYDGVTYTSTVYSSYISSDSSNSNAQENTTERENFNNQFGSVEGNIVTGSTGTHTIEYSTVNENGYIPQSIYEYDSEWMSIKSSTDKVEINEDTEECLKHINLGLRGRDIFDLELTSDVYSTKVTVNGVDGTYNYNSNKVTVKRENLENYNYDEDFANLRSQKSSYVGNQYDQNVRSSDINDTELSIKVTYKITVTNASKTAGTATKITNYYDSKYSFVGAYSDSSCSGESLDKEDGDSKTNYKSVVITTPGTQLNQSDTMEIYVVYSLNNAAKTLGALNDKLATYNMAEITAYKTINTGNESTRGLLDKDSAPGSAATEKVRLVPNSIGNVSTVDYYFGGNDLGKLKYEDDTYATPTLYFVNDTSNSRTITGTVFEDKTLTDDTKKIKTGNGILDEGEVGVYGVTVQLIEKGDSNDTVKSTKTTNENGQFTFSDFLPGNYIIRYYYGDTANTVLLHQLYLSQTDSVNNTSYNGEDFQATNNSGTGEEIKQIVTKTTTNEAGNAVESNEEKTLTTNKLSDVVDYWYLYNEEKGISTATDNTERRKEVSNVVSAYTTDKLDILNNMRNGTTTAISNTSEEEIMKDTYMYADTPQMHFDVEKRELANNGEKKVKTSFGEYKIANMNFGIAEVPVTTVDLKKYVSEFKITDSTGNNVIASGKKVTDTNGDTTWNTTGSVLAPERYIDVSIENEQLQGARLEIEYTISLESTVEKNFNDSNSESPAVPTVKGIYDFVDNNLSYNEKLGKNSTYWEPTTYEKVTENYEGLKEPGSSINPESKAYNNNNTILKSKSSNPLLTLVDGKGTVTVTLEKVLTAIDSSIESIIKDLDTSTYENKIEISELDYSNTSSETTGGATGSGSGGESGAGTGTSTTETTSMKDRIRNNEGLAILPGISADYAASETLVIHPPTGDMSIAMIYLLVAILSLGILAGGIFGIKKFVIKK